MGSPSRDLSSRTNPAILAELLDPIPVAELPFLGRNCTSISVLRKAAYRFSKTLARFV
jgi:hypothetical protein